MSRPVIRFFINTKDSQYYYLCRIYVSPLIGIHKLFNMATESKRQQRFAGVIQQDLAELFQREGSSWAPGVFITVTKVRITSDLAIARVYLSFLKTATAQADLASLRKKTNEIRYKLGERIKHQARIVPQLEFFLDDTNEYVEKMDKLFEEISKETRQPD